MATQELLDRIAAAETVNDTQVATLFSIVDDMQTLLVERTAELAAETAGNDTLTQMVTDDEAENAERQTAIDALGQTITTAKTRKR